MSRPRCRGARGASILELALIAPVMGVLVLGVLDLGRAYRLQIRLENAAREGAAHAQLHPSQVDCTSDGDILGRVAAEDDELPARPGWAVTVSAVADDGTTTEIDGCELAEVGDGERVRVDTRADLSILAPLVAAIVGDTLTIRGSTEVEVLG